MDSFLSKRRRRRLERRFRELDKQLAAARMGHVGDLGPRDYTFDDLGFEPRRRRPVRTFLVTVFVLTLAGLMFWTSLDSGSSPLSSLSRQPVKGAGGFKFASMQDGGTAPVAWDPCQPLHFVVSGTPPKGAESMVERAAAELSTATKLRIVYDGTTSERPSERRNYRQDRYGKGWAPVLVAWSDPTEVPDLAGDVLGQGGGAWATEESGLKVYISGAISFDTPQINKALRGGNSKMAYAVVLHEFAHVLGLAHTEDTTQIMFEHANPKVTSLGGGDRKGLSILGQGKCSTELY